MEWIKKNRFWSFTRRPKEREIFFERNGGMLLEKMLWFSNGKSTPIRNFSEKELILATNNFDANNFIKDDGFRLWKGSLGSQLVLVKMYHGCNERHMSEAIWDIVMASQMSKHKYVLKLIGCCLEFEFPIAVFEYAGWLGLDDYLKISRANHDVNLEFNWERRLRIANQIANVVLYLHTALPLAVVHRNLKPGSVIIDQFGDAKLCDLSLSIPIPDGETKVETEDNIGTPDSSRYLGYLGCLDPLYFSTGFVSAKTDVYSFGMILLNLLTGLKAYRPREDDVYLPDYVKECVDSDSWVKVLDPILLGDGASYDLFKATLKLALKCVELEEDNRPHMIDVARELRKIEKVQKQITQ